MTNARKVTVKLMNTFELSYNDLILGEFRPVSKWEGMAKLVASNGDIIIVECQESFIDNLFRGIFDEKESQDFTIVSASPSILAKIA